MKFLPLVLVLVVCLQVFSQVSAVGKNIPLFPLPAVDFSDLSVLDELAVSTVANALTTVGALQITGIPHFASSRIKALQPAAACLLADSSAPSVQMGDNKYRVSTAALTSSGIPGPMSGDCGQEADSLRASVDGAVYQLLKSMDKYSMDFQNNDRRKASEFVMEPYRRYSDIYQNGEHLEHLHAFFNSDKTSTLTEDATPTLDFHTDAGLFIAMTTGLYTSEAGDLLPDETNGLYLQLLSGSVVEVQTKEDALIIMVGDGGARWLAPLLGASLRAAPHSLRVASSTQLAQSRAWFGKMFLPPSDALLPTAAAVSDEEPLRYDKYRMLERQHLSTSTATVSPESLPSACGHTMPPSGAMIGRGSSSGHDHNHGNPLASSYLHLAALGNDLCTGDDGTGVMCWTQCYSVADLPCGTSAECVDTATGEVVDGNIMCPSDHQNCELQCVDHSGGETNSVNSTDTYDDYCWGTGSTMYMSGFASIVSSKKGDTACINLFFEDWTLDNKSAFAGACIGVFFLGIVIEVLVMARRVMFATMPKGRVRDLLMVLLHGTNVVLSYFIMLVAMTYNVELFCMAVVGLTCGYMAFNLAEPPRHTTDPCCSLGHEEGAAIPVDNPMYESDSATSELHTVSYQVEGPLQDQQQLHALRQEVLAVTGVRTCEVTDKQIAEVTYYGDANMAHHIAITIGLSLGGLTVNHQDHVSTFFQIDGMTCGSCTETVRRAASQVHGVKYCHVHLKRELCGVVMPRSVSSAEAVIAAIESVGFDAKAAVANKV